VIETDNLWLCMLAFFVLIGCGGATDHWTGSVDAVFSYRPSDNSTVIHKIRAESFAKKAGLNVEDILLAVDGVEVTNSSYKTVRKALRGPVGTEAVLTIKRGEEILEITIERRPIDNSSQQ
jgi:C-terminal processing protease CtpA/Prc